MLVLTRKQKEEIRIGQDVTITIVRVKGNSVQIGISAPRSIRVVRGEISQFSSTGALLPGNAGHEPPHGDASGRLTVKPSAANGPLAKRFSCRTRLADSMLTATSASPRIG